MLRSFKTGPTDIDPVVFEQVVATLFHSVPGWWAKPTRRSRDHGIDVVVGIGDRRIGVQVKRYQSDRRVSAPEIRECAGAQTAFNLDRFLVVTTSGYTTPAKRTAATLDIGLLLFEDLLQNDLGRPNRWLPNEHS